MSGESPVRCYWCGKRIKEPYLVYVGVGESATLVCHKGGCEEQCRKAIQDHALWPLRERLAEAIVRGRP